MEKIIVFGGTFNPPHIAHRQILELVRSSFPQHKILVIPTALPPHKQADSLASNAHRMAMCEIMAKGIANTEISDIEISRGGKSYTYDTLLQINKMYPDKKAVLVCGGDMIASFDKWYRYEDILSLAEIFAFRRESTEDSRFDASVNRLRSLGGNITVAENRVIGVSSTEIRDNKNGFFAEKYLQKEIADYIKKNRLYGVE